ncbi:hypothetical protein L9F63_006976, partial [Diploptera punctata]
PYAQRIIKISTFFFSAVFEMDQKSRMRDRNAEHGRELYSEKTRLATMVLHWMFYCLMAMTSVSGADRKCEGIGQPLKYLWGDALSDPPDCIGPNGNSYPTATISRTFKNLAGWGTSRTGRSYNPIDPLLTQKTLLHNYQLANNAVPDLITSTSRTGRNGLHKYTPREACGGTPARLCKTRYNTTAPMYGVSLTSGQPVTIVQKFPDLLQQVVFEVCESSECDVVRGECTQTYVPYLFLVIPLGPVTLTGQDYVLVESGCVCKPKLLSEINISIHLLKAYLYLVLECYSFPGASLAILTVILSYDIVELSSLVRRIFKTEKQHKVVVYKRKNNKLLASAGSFTPRKLTSYLIVCGFSACINHSSTMASTSGSDDMEVAEISTQCALDIKYFKVAAQIKGYFYIIINYLQTFPDYDIGGPSRTTNAPMRPPQTGTL